MVKKFLSIIFVLILLLILIGCNNSSKPNDSSNDNNDKEDEHVECVHEFQDGKCIKCGYECVHEFVDHVCKICGYEEEVACVHEFQDGICIKCGYECSHEFENGVCKVCGFACEHAYLNGECTKCHYMCPHEHNTDGICDECQMNIQSICKHHFELGVCTKCSYHCPHEHQVAGMCLDCGVDIQKVCEHKFKDGVCQICGFECDHGDTHCTYRCPICGDYVKHKYYGGVCQVCGEVGMVEKEIPSKYTQECMLHGLVEKTVFTSYNYGTNVSYENTFFVYLPVGYYTNDRDYNVLYLLHGSGENSAYWLAQLGYAGGYTELTKKVLDNLFFYGLVKDTIIVTPTQRLNGTDNFYKELIGNIMPLAETKYRTKAHLYGKKVSDVRASDFISSRDGRAIAGLSQGAIISWRVMGNLYPYFAYYGMYSGGAYAGLEKVKSTLNDPKNADYDIKWCYNSCGDNDSMYSQHYSDYITVCNSTDKMKKDVNSNFLTKRGFGHTYSAWIIDLYNSLGFCFFKEKIETKE